MVVNKSMLNSEMDVSMPMVAYFKRSTKPHPKAPVGVSPSECHTRELVENFLYVYTCMDVSYMYVIQYVLLNCVVFSIELQRIAVFVVRIFA